MKILLIDNSSLTPVDDDFCSEPKTGFFALELKNLGNHITMYGQKIPATDTVHTFHLIKNGIRVVGLRRRKNKLFNYLLIHLHIIPEIIRAEFVYLFYPSSYKYVTALCWLFKTKYGLYIRGERGLNNKISNLLYKNASAIFTVSDFFTNQINIELQRKTAHTIRPMIPFTDNDLIVNRNYKNKEKINILFLGRIAHDKGVAELLEAAKILKDNGRDFNLNIVGNGEFLQNAKQLIEYYNINDVVFLWGAIFEPDAVKSYYINADLYILPTYHEGFPRTLYEAMIFGTPIITTFVGGIPALMKDGFNCLEIKPQSVGSIIKALEFAMDNYDKMKNIAQNGSNTVQKIVDRKRPTHAEHLNKIINNSQFN